MSMESKDGVSQPSSASAAPVSTAALPDSLYSPETRDTILKPLNWQATETPVWRSKDLPPTSQMLREIQAASEWRHNLPDSAKEFIERFARNAAAQWVFASNVLDGVGMQTEQETIEILQEAIDQHESPNCPPESLSSVANKAQRETIQQFTAMKYLNAQFKQAQKEHQESTDPVIVTNGISEGVDATLSRAAAFNFAACLDVSQILEAHRLLTEKVMHHERMSGAFRERDVLTHSFLLPWEFHRYPFFDNGAAGVATAMDALLDEFHEMLVATPSLSASRTKSPADHEAAISTLFKLAAWLLFQVVDLHPFADGNGRMGRLLANQVLALECPFPVAPYPVYRSPVVPSDISCSLYRREKKGINQPSEYVPYSVSVHAAKPANYYVAAIEKCRYGAAGVEPLPAALAEQQKKRGLPTTRLLQHPCDIAALLIENAWGSWRALQIDLHKNNFQSNASVACTSTCQLE